MEDEVLAEIANGLYAKPLDTFVAARTAAAKEASGASKDLGAAVRALPKPSVAAWAVNMLSRHRPEVLEDLAGLGLRMQAAQSSLDAPALRELGRERRALLSTAVDYAAAVAREQGRAISGTIASAVEETLRALTADQGAAAAIRSGRLITTLSADGVNSVDLNGAVAVPSALPAPPAVHAPTVQAPAPAAPETAAAAPAASAPGKQKKESTTAAGAARPKVNKPRLEAVRQTPRPASPPALEKAKSALTEARAAEAETARLATELQDEADDARSEIAELLEETAELRARLKTAEAKLERSRKKLAATTAEAKQAVRAAERAERTAMLAEERVLRLGNTRT